MTEIPQKPTLEEEAQEIREPVYDSAIEHKNASFDMLMVCGYNMNPTFNKKEVLRIVNERYYPQLLDAFEQKHGIVDHIYRCSHKYGCAVVLTAKNKLLVVYSDKDASVHGFITQCEILAADANRLLGQHGRDLNTCLNMLYDLISNLLNYIDIKPKKEIEKDELAKHIKDLTKKLEDISNLFLRSAQKEARIRYFYGMMIGLVVVGFEYKIVERLLSEVVIPASAPGPILITLITGGIGAIISVMSRISSGRLKLDHEAGCRETLLFGAFRPIIGSILGFIIFSLILSELLPIRVPSGVSTQMYFSISIGFLAGFTERWAQYLIGVAQSQLTTEPENEKSEDVDGQPTIKKTTT